ncbi:MAG: transcription-repair coupling factor [Planctomycetes bacterium]|uniref:transcription-repair coupling factor n=1 Tax=Candidatus Wunengus sp. YC65 TaxID=3367701 RepID=UPI001DC1F9B9|nr:transcription-repair coupling factor [Planctomycetota bacterium]
MKDFIKLLQANKQYSEILHQLRTGKDCTVNGLWGSSASFFIAALASEQLKATKTHPRILLVVPSVEEAEEDVEDLKTFLNGHVGLFPAGEDIFTNNFENEGEVLAQRLHILNQLLYGDIHDGSKFDIIVTPIQALLQPVPSPKSITKNIMSLQRNHEYPREELVSWLQKHHYQLTSQVENFGEYALRGGIVDIFPYASDVPYRIEYFGDEIESIRRFNIESQQSERELDSCQILSVDKIHETNALQSEHGKTSLLSYLNNYTWIVLKEPARIEDRVRKILTDAKANEGLFTYDETVHPHLNLPPPPFSPSVRGTGGGIQGDNEYSPPLVGGVRGGGKLFTYDEISSQFNTFVKISLEKLPLTLNTGDYTFHVKSADNFPHNIQAIASEFNTVIETHARTIVFCNNVAEEQRFQEIIHDLRFERDKRLELRIGHLSKGFQFSDIQIAILAHHEIFHRYKQRREVKKPIQTRAIDSFLDLKKGDYVVHISHGIGRFLGMETLEEEGYKREYLIIEYDERTKIYVPATKIELVQKYIGSSDHRPRLDKIGSKYWEIRKKRAENAAADIASDLLHVQALRNAKEGIVYPNDTDWQTEFEAEFIYEETPDQIQVIRDIKKDMESKRPMDRLICGDVGYGKTELAMRSAFKSVMFGKQVAVLVPTTILAQQHYSTFSERMADYPVKIDVLSRFKTRKEQKETLEKTSAGLVDILIGTHRILQKDVYFKDLGLVIIDEEQRFGVEHKERLKKFRQMVDVLTLTATPIPRTLHMSLMGIKDISSLNTPPLGRQAIHTQIIRYDQERIRQAIRLELNRDGQVYFVHNRVYNIERIARNLSEIVPEARIMTVHGQMDEKLMEHRMRAFVDGQADILVATTIIESGLDIPNVNTIFINCADTFGLADLHQLRGRVGRYKHRAYAYIILPNDRPVTPEAEKRVKAIEEFAELGAGFKIAMRDLEIRGAGNILGTEQHGHIAAVGYEMYCRLLELAVRKARHEPVEEPLDVSIDLNLESFIPKSYIPEDALKMDIYRRLNRSTTFEEIQHISEEMTDRFGGVPHPVKNLLSESELRILAQKSKIRSMVWVDNIVIIQVADLKKAETGLSNLKKHIRVINENTLHLRLPKKEMKPEDLLDFFNKSFKI